jgi:uncharacterized membrane protein
MVQNAEVLGARFATRSEADVVRTAVEALGYDPMEVSYIADAATCSSTFDEPGSHWQKMGLGGSLGGGTLAGVGGAIAGIGTVAFLGPVSALIGVVTGGIIGVLVGAGLDSDNAVACANEIKAGELVLVVQTHSGDSGRVRAALGDHLIAAENDTFVASTPKSE